MNFQQGYRPPQPPPAPKPPRKKWPILVLVLLVIIAGIAGVYGYKYIQDVKAEQARIKALTDAVAPYNDTYLPGIYVDGLSLGGMTAQEGIDAVLAQIKERQTGWSLGLTYRSHLFYTLHYPDFGVATDVGSVVYGRQAVEMGLIDRLGGLSDALGCLHEMIDAGKQ